MTVRELIAELEKIEDKDLDVVFHGEDYKIEVAEDVFESTQYYGKAEGYSWCAYTRKCVLIC